MFKIKRIYETPEDEDKYRVLVDRLWPRGLSKDKAKVDLWMKDIAPSNDLRKWFGHEENKWPEFKERYLDELRKKKEMIKDLKSLENFHKTVTILYAAKDEEHNNAVVLFEVLDNPQMVLRKGISRTHGS
jgi:uncharacterized protein YeaO (DUF488 family)